MATKTATKRKTGAAAKNGAAATNRIKGALPAKQGKQTEKVCIPKPDLATFDVVLKGTTPLIVHKFSEKAKQAIEDKQKQKANKPKEKRDPHAEYLAACYVFRGHKAGTKGCVYGIRAVSIKAAMVAACRYVDAEMTFLRGAVQVLAEEGDLVRLKYKKMTMCEDAVRINNGKSFDLRYRPEYTEWSIRVTIRYFRSVISAEQILNLLSIAGFACGLCEKRPNSKSGPGESNGMFEVETAL